MSREASVFWIHAGRPYPIPSVDRSPTLETIQEYLDPFGISRAAAAARGPMNGAAEKVFRTSVTGGPMRGIRMASLGVIVGVAAGNERDVVISIT